MSILEIFICPLVLCCILNIVIVTFPEAYKKTTARKRINGLLLISAAIYGAVIIILAIINNYLLFPQINLRVAVLLILLLAILLFAINIYYPTMRLYVNAQQNKYDFSKTLYMMIVDYRYGTMDERECVINKMSAFIVEHKSELYKTHENILIKKLIEDSTTSTQKAPEKLIDLIENSCSKDMEDANNPANPFSNLGLISSFSFSAILTILLAFIAL